MDLPQTLNHHSHNRSRYVTVTNHPDDHPNFPNPPRHSETLRNNNHHHQQQQNQLHFHHQNSRQFPLPPPPPLPPSSTPFKTPTRQGYNAAEKPQYSYANFSHERSYEESNRSSRPSSSIVRGNFSPAQQRLGFDDRDDRRRVFLPGRSPEFDQVTRSEFWEQPRVLKENPPEVSQKFCVDFNDSDVSQKFLPGHNKSELSYKTSSRLRLETESGSSRFRLEYGDTFEPMKHGDESHKGYYRRSDSVSSSGVSVREVEFVPRQILPSRNSESRSEIYNGRHEDEFVRTGRRDVVYGNQRRIFDRKVLREVPSSPYKREASEIVNGDGVHFVSVQHKYPDSESGRYGHGSRGNSYQNDRSPRKQYQKKSALLRIQKPYQRNTGNEKFGYYNKEDSSGSSSFRHRDQYAYIGRESDEGQVEESPVHLDVSFKSNSLVAKAVMTPPRASNDPDTNLTPSNSKDITKEYDSDRNCSNVDLPKPIGGFTDLGGSTEATNSGKEIVQTEEKVRSVEDLGDSNLPVTLNVIGQLLKNKETQKSPEGAEPQKDRVGSVKPSLKVTKKKKVVKKIVKKVVRPRPRVVLNFQKKKLEGPLPSDACVFQPKDFITPMDVASEVNRLGTVKVVEGTQLGGKSEEHVTDLKSNTYAITDNSGNKSSTVMESSVQEEDKSPECAPNSSKGLHTISERNRDIANSYILSCAVNAEHVVNHIQPHQIGDALIGYKMDHAFSNSGHTKLYDNGIGVSDAAICAGIPMITMNDTTFLKEECAVGEEIPKGILRSSQKGDFFTPTEVAMNIYSSNREENIISSTSTADCLIKQLSTDAAIRLSKVDAADTSVSVGKNKEGASPNKRNKRARQKRKVRSQLDFSRESSSNLDATNVFKYATYMDTLLNLSSQNPSYELAASTSGNSDPDRDAPPLSSPYGISEANIVSRDNVDSAFRDSSLQCSKKRRVSTFGLTPQAEENSVNRSLSCVESPSNDILIQHEMNISVFTPRTSCAATNLGSSVPGIIGFHDNKLAEVSSTSNCVGNFSNDEQDKGGVVKAINMQVRREEAEAEAEAEAVGVVVLREQDAACEGTLPHPVISRVQHLNTVGTSPCTSVEESDSLLEKGDFHNSLNYLSTPTDCSEATSVDEAVDCVPNLLTSTGSPQILFNIFDVDVSVTTSVSKLSKGTFLDDTKLEKKPANDSNSDIYAKNSFPQSPKRQSMPDRISGIQKVERNTSLTLLDSGSLSEGLNVKSVASIRQKNQHGHTTAAIPGPSTSQPATMKKRAFPTNAGARTWHRTSSTPPLPVANPCTQNVPLQKQLPKRDGKLQSTSYVRKGNSLVRNPSLSSALPQGSGSIPVYQLNTVGSDVSKKIFEAENRVIVNSHGLMSRERKESSYEPTSLVERGKKLLSSTIVRSGDLMPSTSAGSLSSGHGDLNSETILLLENNGPAKLVEDSSTTEVLENQSQVNKSNNPAVLNDGNLKSLNTKNIVYVKRKLNQLVATSNSVDLPVVKADKSQAPSSDGYYKRKNQLIRTSLDSHRREPVFMSDKSGGQMTLNAASSLKLSRRRSLKVVAKTFKRSRNSLVWTSALSKKSNSGPLTHQKVFPQLFPWKRSAYCRSFMHNWSFISKSSSSMAIRKLLVSRQRDTVYTRSINGFSLRKSKVLSVGGSSLKWSKSIESHSKKANEEATLAVAAVERKKREQKGSAYPSSGSRSKNHTLRERIFRVGLFRYKMDPSRQTLQRISDDESPSAPSSSLDKDAKRLYIPRRLVIGNDEYVRIGNGNQLIRDPKKRTRILANEKVRWSLHAARLRLAKKRKYCQFFTRFGRCNKDSGKCPYLHDPSKIAVCTKFLKGLCSNGNCKLTHKVIPERMPDCSYYLQGLCTNQSCPYRHVNVNPKASTCDGFLRGYCANGDECRKKHSHVCPSFEATGTCPRRSKCKLHHPKNRVHAEKKRRSREPRNSTGRYFGSPDPNVMSDKCFAQENKDIFLEEGTCADYIAMGVSDDDTGENNDPRTTQTLFCDNGTPSDFEDLDDLAKLIKPIRLMSAKSNSVVA